jgi:hypothetical protein
MSFPHDNVENADNSQAFNSLVFDSDMTANAFTDTMLAQNVELQDIENPAASNHLNNSELPQSNGAKVPNFQEILKGIQGLRQMYQPPGAMGVSSPVGPINSNDARSRKLADQQSQPERTFGLMDSFNNDQGQKNIDFIESEDHEDNHGLPRMQQNQESVQDQALFNCVDIINSQSKQLEELDYELERLRQSNNQLAWDNYNLQMYNNELQLNTRPYYYDAQSLHEYICNEIINIDIKLSELDKAFIPKLLDNITENEKLKELSVINNELNKITEKMNDFNESLEAIKNKWSRKAVAAAIDDMVLLKMEGAPVAEKPDYSKLTSVNNNNHQLSNAEIIAAKKDIIESTIHNIYMYCGTLSNNIKKVTNQDTKDALIDLKNIYFLIKKIWLKVLDDNQSSVATPQHITILEHLIFMINTCHAIFNAHVSAFTLKSNIMKNINKINESHKQFNDEISDLIGQINSNLQVTQEPAPVPAPVPAIQKPNRKLIEAIGSLDEPNKLKNALQSLIAPTKLFMELQNLKLPESVIQLINALLASHALLKIVLDPKCAPIGPERLRAQRILVKGVNSLKNLLGDAVLQSIETVPSLMMLLGESEAAITPAPQELILALRALEVPKNAFGVIQ